MIVAERKPLEKIFEMIKPYNKVLVLGCKTCVAVCLTGGEKEAETLSKAINLHRKKENQEGKTTHKSLERQCEFEFADELKDEIDQYDVVLSMACGAGIQTIAERYPEKIVLPAVNTSFIGVPREQGVWLENCLACGDCVLDFTQGVCPVARCTKSMLNGPCGGSQDGKCEVDPETDCGWQLIYDRLKSLGKLDVLTEVKPPKDWSTSHAGGPRKQVREDVRL